MSEEDIIADFFEHGEIEGYSLPELTVFAKACRENGITNDDLSDYVHNIKAAYEYAMEMIIDEFEKSEQRMKMVKRVTVESVMGDGESE